MTIEIDGVNNTLKTDKIEPQSGTALQVGASGDTITLPSGATLNIAGTITNSGTATGFGAVDWQTSDVKTSTFTAVAGKGYLVNTTGGAITVNLPAGSAGAQIALADYAGTWDTNNCTVAANGSEKIQGTSDNAIFSRDREALQILYVDSTQGWIITSVADQGGAQAVYTVASGGTETTSGDYKIHTFNSSGTFTVSTVGNSFGGGDKVSYVVVAGGAGGGARHGGGGGAGGFREGAISTDPYYPARSPLSSTDGLTISAQAYPITVGSGGSGVTSPPMDASATNGAASVFSTITSTGGGHGGGYPSNSAEPGGSGGGGGGNLQSTSAGGTGNTPPVSPPQGASGGNGSGGGCSGAGAGGATAAGGDTPVSGAGTAGGAGAASSITGSSVTRAGGGGGCPTGPEVPGGGTTAGGAGGGGGGTGNAGGTAVSGTANTGGGGGGNRSPGGTCGASGSGGSGVVIIRYKYQN
jgi:hypothetical protein